MCMVVSQSKGNLHLVIMKPLINYKLIGWHKIFRLCRALHVLIIMHFMLLAVT